MANNRLQGIHVIPKDWVHLNQVINELGRLFINADTSVSDMVHDTALVSNSILSVESFLSNEIASVEVTAASDLTIISDKITSEETAWRAAVNSDEIFLSDIAVKINSDLIYLAPDHPHQNVNAAASPTFAGLTLSELTNTRVPYITTGGQLTDTTNFNFNGTTTLTIPTTLKIIQSGKIVAGTSDGSDNQFISVSGGGAVDGDRGANFICEGNEYPVDGFRGCLFLEAGNARTVVFEGAIKFWTRSCKNRGLIDYYGNWLIGDWAVLGREPNAPLEIFNTNPQLKLSYGAAINTVLSSDSGGNFVITPSAGALTGLLKGTSGVVSAITDNSANWDIAYGWGNHASAGYLTSETDPIVKAINGIIKSNGTTISAAIAGTDYQSGSLTASRIPYAVGSPATLIDSPNLICTGTSLQIRQCITFGDDSVNAGGLVFDFNQAQAVYLSNFYYVGGNKYWRDGGSSAMFFQITGSQAGDIFWWTAPSGNAGDTINYTERMRLSQAGILTVGALTIGSLSGLLKAASGVVSAAVAGTDYQSGSLTAGRIPFATGSPATLMDSANLTFDGTTFGLSGKTAIIPPSTSGTLFSVDNTTTPINMAGLATLNIPYKFVTNYSGTIDTIGLRYGTLFSASQLADFSGPTSITSSLINANLITAWNGDYTVTSGKAVGSATVKGLILDSRAGSFATFTSDVAIGLNVNIYGGDFYAGNNSAWVQITGPLTGNFYGGIFQIGQLGDNPTISGTVNFNYYGGYFSANPPAVGTTRVCYGGYFSALNGTTNWGIYVANGYAYLGSIRAGATQGGAGAVAGEVWKTSGHATLPDNVLMIGV